MTVERHLFEVVIRRVKVREGKTRGRLVAGRGPTSALGGCTADVAEELSMLTERQPVVQRTAPLRCRSEICMLIMQQPGKALDTICRDC